MFEQLRIQIINPCKARCLWCGTWKKNSVFNKLKNDGTLDVLVDTYKEFIRHYKPKVVNISGGEPILYGKINEFLNDIEPFVEEINLFISYQFGRNTRNKIDVENLPHDKLVLNHTTNGFDKDYWLKFTQGFPFELYLENIKYFAKLPCRKRYKLIVNYGNYKENERLLRELIGDAQGVIIEYKLINNQAGDYGKEQIEITKENVLGIVKQETKVSHKQTIQKVLLQKYEECPFRLNPIELRFAFYTSNQNGTKLKYRFCPYFPLDKHFIFKLGRDTIEDINENYFSQKWFKWCRKCRLNLYK